MAQPPPYGYSQPYQGGAPPPAGWAPEMQPPPPAGAGIPPAGNFGYGQPPPPNYGYAGPGGQPPPMPPPMPGYVPTGVAYNTDTDTEAPKYGGIGFDDKAIRRGFIRKVFALLTLMLLVVVGMIAIFRFPQNGTLHRFVKENPIVYFVSYGVFLVTYIALMCCESVRRNFPSNLIMMGLLTVSIGYMTAMITAMYNTDIVFLAMGITAGCCFSIIIFSMQTKYDFTSCMGVMFVVFMCVFLFGIFAIIYTAISGNRIVYLIYAGLMAIVFMIFLAIDVQMVMGGKKYEISPEDYIFATIQLFLDIIYIFWFLLQIIGGASSD